VLRKCGAQVACVTPSHHYPLGIVMSIGRRMEMLGWANERQGRYIIEDDYDSEFRYRGKPIPALQGLDHNGKVIYIGTFSKSISPGLRISYMVLPDTLMDSYAKVGVRYSNTVSRIDQNIVNLFIKEGYYERHLNKMRGIYKAKHDALLAALKKMGKGYKISGESAGLHILLSSDKLSEAEMVQRAGKKE
ncbi:MAG: PLP-dependent aminotransferase family protein, partial [Lachnospiraceae bacterium]